MSVELDIQRVVDAGPSEEQMKTWVDAVLQHEQQGERERRQKVGAAQHQDQER